MHLFYNWISICIERRLTQVLIVTNTLITQKKKTNSSVWSTLNILYYIDCKISEKKNKTSKFKNENIFNVKTF